MNDFGFARGQFLLDFKRHDTRGGVDSQAIALRQHVHVQAAQVRKKFDGGPWHHRRTFSAKRIGLTAWADPRSRSKWHFSARLNSSGDKTFAFAILSRLSILT